MIKEQKRMNSVRADNDEKWAEAFKAFDVNGNGNLSKVEFIMFFNEISPELPQQSVEMMFAITDVDCSGSITYDEFGNMLNYIS